MRRMKISAVTFLSLLFMYTGSRAFAQADLSVLYSTNVIPNVLSPAFSLGSWYINGVTNYTLAIKNASTTNTITFNSSFARVDVSGDAEFTLPADLPTTALGPGGTRNFFIKFTAPAGVPSPAEKTATIQVHYIGANLTAYTYAFKVSVTVTAFAVPQVNLRFQGGTVIPRNATDVIDFTSHTIYTSTTSPTVIAIENVGSADVTGLSITPAACFSASALSGTTILVGGAARTFQLTFTPTARVNYAGSIVTVKSNDSDYSFSVDGLGTGSEIDVTKPGGASIPSYAGPDWASSTYDFGDVLFGAPLELTFHVYDTDAITDLSLSPAASITAVNPTTNNGFTMPTSPPASVLAGHNEIFTIKFDPKVRALCTAEIDIPNNDPDGNEAPYVFRVTATGRAPLIALSHKIGAASPTALANGTGVIDFGDVTKGSDSATEDLLIDNTGGNYALTVASITKAGDTGGEFVSDWPTTSFTVGAGASGTYHVHFHPASDGPKSATITIANDDPTPAQQSYVFTLKGNDPSASVKVTQVLPSSEPSVDPAIPVDYGWQAKGAPSSAFAFRIYDTGNEDMKNIAVSIAGTNAGDFAISSPLSSTTATQGGASHSDLAITFTPGGTGDRTATITVTGDDKGESVPGAHPRSLQFTVKGKGFNKPTAQIDPPAGLLKKLDAAPLVYYAQAPLTVTVHATTTYATQVEWDLGTGSYGSPEAALTKTLSLDVGLHDVRVIPLDADGNQGDSATISIGAYPNDIASIPPAWGVPFDNEPPFIDGILAYSDGNLDHAKPWDSSSPLVDYGENGWTGCLSLPFADGSTPNARIDCIRSGNFLFFAFHVESDNTPATDDQIVVGIGNGKDSRITDKDKIGIFTISTAAASGTASTAGVTVSSYTTDPAHTDPADPGIWSAAGAPPAGTSFAVRPDAGSTNSWSAELKVPISGTGLAWLDSLAGNFLLFVRIDKIEPNPTSPPPTTDAPFVWPRGIPATVASQELHSEWWGLACHDGSIASNGLSIASIADIGVRTDPANTTAPLVNAFSYRNKPTPNDIVNYVVARVTNDARLDRVDASGNPVTTPLDAQNVTVRFKLADWGIPSPDPTYWHDIVQPTDAGNPSTPNPPTADTVPAPTLAGTVLTPSTKDFIMKWQLSASQVNDVTSGLTAVNGEPVWHQCMLAQIETGGTGTGTHPVSIVTRSMCRNMDFTGKNEGPGFSSDATVSAKGLDTFVAGIKANARAQGDDRVILLRLYTRNWQESPKSLAAADGEKARRTESARRLSSAELPGPVKPTPLPGAQHYLDELRSYIEEAQKTVYFTEYIVKAYVYTGRKVQRGSKASDEVAPLGSYGYVVRHVGFTEGWSFHIDGAEKIDYRTYLIRVKNNQSWEITDHIKAVLPPRWSFGLMGGAGWGIPGAGDNTSAGGSVTGICMLNSDADEKGQIASLQLGLGYDSFPAGGSADAWKTGSLSLAARFSLPLLVDWFRWYCTMGGGLFQNDSSALKIGWVVGTGLDLGISYPIHVQLGADALINKAAGGLLHLNAGLIYRLTR